MKSYIKFLSRNKLYTAIEVVGLSLSLAFVILLSVYVLQQYQVINENPDVDRIFLLGTKRGPGLSSNEKLIFQSQPLPEVEAIARYELDANYPVKIEDERRFVRAAMIDMEWFDIFPYYKIVSGSPEMLNDLGNVFVSQSFANTLGKDVIGKSICALPSDERAPSMSGGRVFVVAGIIQDFENTLFQKCDILMNGRSYWPDHEGIVYYNWGSVYNFVRLSEAADADVVEEKAVDVLKSTVPYVFSDDVTMPRLWSVKEAFFVKYSWLSNADEKVLKKLIIIAIALLISAVFNYINLSFALMTKRAGEMATRRLVGAGRADILWNCIKESVIFTVLCFALAVLLAEAFEPAMNSLLIGYNPDSFVPVDIAFSFRYVFVGLAFAVLLGVVVGIVPAINASAFAPIDVVKGAFRAKTKMVFSKCFIVVQNMLAVILISMGILMEVQLSHMLNRPMNAETKNLFFVECEFLDNPSMAQPLYDALMKNPGVERVGFGNGFPGNIGWSKSYLTVEDANSERITANVLSCDSVYFNMLSLNMVEDLHTNLNSSLWLSESIKEVWRWDDEVAATVFGSRWNPTTDHLGGVYKDVPAFLDMTEYTVIEVLPWEKIDHGCCIIIETISESKEIRESIRKTYEEFSKECVGTAMISGRCGFMGDLHKEMLARNIRIIRLVEIFMVLAVLLSLLGLLAMSTYFSEQKSKEIAIRKVFGGTIESETVANVRSYMIMVAVACVIGVPVAVYLAGRYLEQFAYRISGYWWIFLLAVLLSFAISLLSVLWQTLRAARTNPATELKKE